MIAAVVRAPCAREHLEAIGRTTGLRPSHFHATPHSGLMAWDCSQPTGFDRDTECVWLGSPRGTLSPAYESEFQSPSGDYCLIALRGDSFVLARGRFGGRPLYYARHEDGSTIACSRLAPLVSALSASPQVDTRRLAAILLTTTYRDFDLTAYKGIQRVVSGATLVVSGERTLTLPRKSLPPPPRVRTPQEAAEELRSLLFRAITRVTKDARRVVMLTGGGVDSSALLGVMLATARGASKREVRALALDFGGIGDDRPYLRALCEALGIAPVRLSPGECAPGGLPGAVIDGAPFPWPTADSDIALLRVARSLGADIVLTGISGDDVFGGDLRAFAAMSLRLRGRFAEGLVSAANLRGSWIRSRAARTWSFFGRPMLGGICPAGLLNTLRAARRPRPPSWAGPVLKEIYTEAFSEQGRDTCEDILSGLARQRAFNSPTYHLDFADYRGQLEARTGSYRVDMMLDEEIVDFVTALPAPFLFHGGFHRGLLREAMRGLVPDEVRLRQDKASATELLQALFCAPGRDEAIRPYVSMQSLGALGIVEPSRFCRAHSRFWKTKSSAAGWIQIWPALATEIFARSVLAGTRWPSEQPSYGSSAAA
jgi:asparagine synthase (glutamine-hydrolysing)